MNSEDCPVDATDLLVSVGDFVAVTALRTKRGNVGTETLPSPLESKNTTLFE